jgi:uncharacterized protein
MAVAASFLAVASSMVALFLLPRSYFVPATFAATIVMLAAAYAVGLRPSFPRTLPVLIGLGSAVLLYFVFYLGNLAVQAAPLPGVNPAGESSIYSLIASPSNPLPVQLGVLLFDAAGYESYFRGTLQARLSPRIGGWSAPAVALVDAGLHIFTFNALWVGTTFVADLVWGLTYRYGGGTTASFTSHLLWDIAIFIIRPIS